MPEFEIKLKFSSDEMLTREEVEEFAEEFIDEVTQEHLFLDKGEKLKLKEVSFSSEQKEKVEKVNG